ncbi:MAG TPA: PAS domain-containing protein [Acidimicrobiales bacterium]|nr:PAS domain-containing protein [Acidimicrobiales bacterium]
MAQQPIEMILMRQLAGNLAMPIFVVDTNGALVYFNLPAEEILGQRFDETGELSWDEWRNAFRPTDRDGNPLPLDDLPLSGVIIHRRPMQRSIWISGFDGVRRYLSVTGFPLVDQSGADLGSVALLWEADEP